MTDQHQHRATDEQWLLAANEALDGSHADSCLIELRDRIQQLEATQHAHITGPSDAGIKAAKLEWAPTAPGMRFADLRVVASGAQVGRSSAEIDRVLALQDQIRDGTLSLADALKDINGEPIERTRQTTYLVEKIRVRMIQEQKNSNSWQAVAEAVLREVAEWLRSEYPQREGYGTAWANLLDNEANL